MLSYRSFITFHCRSHTNKITNVTRLLNSVFSNSFVNVLAESSSVRGVERKEGRTAPCGVLPQSILFQKLYFCSQLSKSAGMIWQPVNGELQGWSYSLSMHHVRESGDDSSNVGLIHNM